MLAFCVGDRFEDSFTGNDAGLKENGEMKNTKTQSRIGVEIVEENGYNEGRIRPVFYTPDGLRDEINGIADGATSWSPSYTRLLVLIEQFYAAVPEVRGNGKNEGVRRITL